jgi:hypothetical protein
MQVVGSWPLEKTETVDDLLATLSEVLGDYAGPHGVETNRQRTSNIPAEQQIQPSRGAPSVLDEQAPPPTWLTEIPKRSRRLTDLPQQTAVQTEGLILQLLRQIPSFPSSGVTVTVYGSRPWNAMLTFAPNSTTLVYAGQYRTFLTEIVCDLRKQFDVDLD